MTRTSELPVMNTTIGTPTGRHTRHEGISAMSVDPSVRIGDAEREHVVAALGQHLSVGRLTMSEFDSRLDTVYADFIAKWSAT